MTFVPVDLSRCGRVRDIRVAGGRPSPVRGVGLRDRAGLVSANRERVVKAEKICSLQSTLHVHFEESALLW